MISDYLNKKKQIFIITAVLIVLLIVISVFIFKDKNKDKNNVQEQDLSITYNIAKDNMYPMDKTNGATNIPLSTIKIKNNKSYQQKYKLVIKTDDKSTLGINKIYIMINNDVKTLSEFEDGVVYTNTIDANQEFVLSFKTWIGEDLIDEYDTDKVASLKYEIITEK